MPKKINPEVKARAVPLVSEHREEYPSVTAAAEAVSKQLGLGRETVRRWVVQADVDAGRRQGASGEEMAEVKALKGENRGVHRDWQYGAAGDAVEHFDVVRAQGSTCDVAASDAEQRLRELAELREARPVGHLPLQENTQPPGQGRLVDNEVRLDPGAHSSRVDHVECRTPRREEPALPGGKACATHYHDRQSPAFSHAVLVEQPSRAVYVGGQNGVDASGSVVDDLAEQTARSQTPWPPIPRLLCSRRCRAWPP